MDGPPRRLGTAIAEYGVPGFLLTAAEATLMLRGITFVAVIAGVPVEAAAQQLCPSQGHVINELYRTVLERWADWGGDPLVERLTSRSTVREIVRDGEVRRASTAVRRAR